MKFIHLSDLHLGKKVNEYSMIDDQKYIIREILRIIDDEEPDGVIIAGDIYDRAVPSVEAVEVFDDFLVGLAAHDLSVFAVSGNHDSAERISFGARIMDKNKIYLSRVYKKGVAPIKLSDEYGEVNVFLLPFIKPANVREYAEKEISSYTDALREAVSAMNVDSKKRNVLVAHQYVTGAERSESEDITVGGIDSVNADVFDAFDYVALGHLHKPQNCGSERIRYCGSPLKYSFSEVENQKSVTVVELGKKGELTVRTVELVPETDMYKIKGKYENLMNRSFYETSPYQESYMHITLTDEDDVPYALNRLRIVYKKLMKLDYDNKRTQTNNKISGDPEAVAKSPDKLFEEFYRQQNNQPMSREQSDFVEKLIGEIWEEQK